MSIGDFINNLASDAEELFSRVKDRPTFERVVNAAYLIGIADGDLSHDEQQKLSLQIQRKLPHFKIADILAAIKNADEIVEFDKETGMIELLDEIAKATGDSKQLIARTALLIAKADGDFDDNEKKTFKAILGRLNIDPSTYQL